MPGHVPATPASRNRLKSAWPRPRSPESPMPLARLHAPFDGPDWIYEVKYDGFRRLAYAESAAALLVSRTDNVFRSFLGSAAAIDAALAVRDAALDGEIVPLDRNGLHSSTN